MNPLFDKIIGWGWAIFGIAVLVAILLAIGGA